MYALSEAHRSRDRGWWKTSIESGSCYMGVEEQKLSLELYCIDFFLSFGNPSVLAMVVMVILGKVVKHMQVTLWV